MITRLLMFCIVLSGHVLAAEPETLTLRLTRHFDALWDSGDSAGMYAFLDPDCVYKTPFRTEIGRVHARKRRPRYGHGP